MREISVKRVYEVSYKRGIDIAALSHHFQGIRNSLTLQDVPFDLFWSPNIAVFVHGDIVSSPGHIFQVTSVSSVFHDVFITIFVMRHSRHIGRLI